MQHSATALHPRPAFVVLLTRTLLAAGALLLAATLGVAGCAGADTPAALTVFAASSLTDAVPALDRAFEATEPAVRVTPSFAGSQVLRLQIEQGAPADAFVSADRRHVRALVDAGLAEEPTVIAENELVVVTPRGNPAGLTRFADLRRAERVVLGDRRAPVGAYAQAVLDRADRVLGAGFATAVRGHVVSEEPNVRLVRAKVELGEADAALVYRTDAVGADVTVLPIPDALSVRAEILAAVVTASPRRELARAWVAHAAGPRGQGVLRDHGFLAPR